jgi:chaperonin cofactor prefoldin
MGELLPKAAMDLIIGAFGALFVWQLRHEGRMKGAETHVSGLEKRMDGLEKRVDDQRERHDELNEKIMTKLSEMSNSLHEIRGEIKGMRDTTEV